MEDLDPLTARPEHERSQLADLEALELGWDPPVVRQSERRERHDAVLRELIDRGLTFPCYCTRREVLEAAAAAHGEGPEGAYPGTCRSLGAAARAEREAAGRRPALRLRVDAGLRVAVEDRLHGRVEGPVDELVLRRGDGVPAYNLAVVVDDADAGVEEVVRGDDLLASTPRQAHLAALLGLPPVSYAHVPLVLGPTGRRLAKRDGAVTLADRAARGQGPLEVRSVLAASVGLAEPGERPSLDALLARFDAARLPREPWVLPASLLA